MDFLQVDVFTDEPYGGNPLAVFPEAAGLSRAQMQAIASEMNLSETTFVTGTERDAYSVRIFTPAEELPFAGHPTIGTAWVLKHLVRVSGQEFLQRSSGGVTSVYEEAGRLWFSRSGEAAGDLESTDPTATAAIAKALGVAPPALELEARELGRSGMLRPAFSNA
ncbi:MAG: PhzF family phenazine biosynthesis protein, partial [Actinobacteria bacterium]|nr:PhzF family phenazine biosynthesis protein [Actinomycetota bacterium]